MGDYIAAIFTFDFLPHLESADLCLGGFDGIHARGALLDQQFNECPRMTKIARAPNCLFC